MVKKSSETRERIMEVAFDLFGRFGVEGTSVRQIAKESDVNLAAINYHFKTKENLFWEIMHETFVEVDACIGSFAKNSKSVKELSLKTYNYFVEDSIGLRNTMKLMLTEIKTPPENKEIMEALDSAMGPPGGVHFGEMIKKEISYKLSQEGVFWGIKSIFGSINHWAMIVSSGHCSQDPKNFLMSEDQIKKDLSRMVDASMEYLENHPKQFKAK